MKAFVLEQRADAAPAPPEEREFGALVQIAIRVGAVAILGYWTWLVVAPLFSILCWGFVLAIALSQLYGRLVRWFGPAMAAILVAIGGLALTIGPMTWLSASLLDGVTRIYSALEANQLKLPAAPAGLDNVWLVGEPLHRAWKLAVENIEDAVRQYSEYLKPVAIAVLGFAKTAFAGVFQLLVATLLAAWILYCGRRMQRLVLRLLRIVFQSQTRPMVRLTVSTIRGIARGVIAVAAIQAALAALGFYAAGTPFPGLLTFAVLALSIIQIGPGLVLLPVCVWAWMTMSPLAAGAFSVYLIVVALLDNVLRPMLISRDVAAPLPLIIAGAIGGVLSLGLIGVFLGPVILSIAWVTLFAHADLRAPNAKTHGKDVPRP